MQDVTQGVTIPYIPASLWVITSALTIAILIIMFLYQVYWRRRQTAFIGDGVDVATLAAQKTMLQADVDTARNWMTEQRNELLRLEAERQDQERVRAELTDLEQRCLVKDQENESLRSEVGQLKNESYQLAQTLERMRNEIGDLEARRGDAEVLERRIEDLQSKVDDATMTLTKMAEADIRFEALGREKLALENSLLDMRSEVEASRVGLDKARANMETAQSEFETVERVVSELRSERSQLDVLVSTLRSEQNSLKRRRSKMPWPSSSR